VPVVIAERAHHRAAFLAVNPRGLVPALDVDGLVITENIAILTWIGHSFPESGLLPLDDLPALVRVYERLSFFVSSVHNGFGRIFRVSRPDLAPPPDEATRKRDREILQAHFVEIDEMLACGEWLLGDRYTVADLYPPIFLRWARRQGFDVDAYRQWQAHARRMLGRPAVRRVIAREGLDPSQFLQSPASRDPGPRRG
jgi:glutathione S-transferase